MRLSQQYIVNMGGQKRPLPAEEFVNHKVGEAIGKIGETVFPLRTPLMPQTPNVCLTEYIIARSAQNYGLHSYSRKMWEAEVKRPDAPKLLPAQKHPPDIDPQRVF
jgi:hypothetical protein